MRTLREIFEQSKDAGRKLVGEMSDAARARKPAGDFVFPDERRWPIKPRKYAVAAIQYMVMGRGDATDYPTVKRAILAAYPDDAELIARVQAV